MNGFRFSTATSAVVAVLVGFGGTLAIIVAASQAVGATTAQTASAVSGLCLAMAGTALVLSIRHRMPIITAWSTPGAALIAANPGIATVEQAVGAFLMVGVLIVFTAAVKPISKLIEAIPASIAAGMLAGVLIGFVIEVFRLVGVDLWFVVPLVLLFFVVRLASPAWAVIAVLIAGVALAFATDRTGDIPVGLEFTTFSFIVPSFDLSVLLGLGIPLYLVTMASQNLPGFAVLRANGYEPPTRSILTVTGLASILTAPLGALTTNLAAITAAICMGPDTHPDKDKRWPTGIFYCLTYLPLAVFGASLVGVFAAMPTVLIATIAGLALIGPLTGAMTAALKDEADRPAAVVTLAVTASGLSIGGIGSAFWGLLAGLLVWGLDRIKR
ncbi:MAG: benzoate/H(+) symporter BenE family transporter [Alphaproteobacteria bacterium]